MASRNIRDPFDDNAKSILLIGSTGQGKSSLASFLVDPKGASQNPAFIRSSSSNSCTTQVDCQSFVFEKNQFNIIDTPGLNDTAGYDAQHMLNLAQVLSSRKELAAIILCMRIDSKLDAQQKYTLSYYCDMFRSCLETNLVLVITNVQMDRRSKRQRERDRFDLEKSVTSIRDAVSEIAGFRVHCSTWLIDSVVEREDVDEYALSISARRAILRDCARKPCSIVDNLAFVKTQDMQLASETLLANIQGRLEGYLVAMVDCKEMAAAQMIAIQHSINCVATFKSELTRILAKLAQLNTDVLVPVDNQLLCNDYIAKSGGPFSFVLNTSHPFETYDILSPYTYSLTDVKVEPTSISALFKNTQLKPIQATITCYAKSSVFHETQISHFQSEVDRLATLLSFHEKTLDAQLSTVSAGQEKSDGLSAFIRQIGYLANTVGEHKIKVAHAVQFMRFLHSRGTTQFREDIWTDWINKQFGAYVDCQ